MNPTTEPGAAFIPPVDRDVLTDNAGRELFHYATQWRERHKLTENEISYVVGVLLLRHLQTVCLEERK